MNFYCHMIGWLDNCVNKQVNTYLSLEIVLFSFFHLALKSAQNSNQSMKKWAAVTSFSPVLGLSPKYRTRSWKLSRKRFGGIKDTINQDGDAHLFQLNLIFNQNQCMMCLVYEAGCNDFDSSAYWETKLFKQPETENL